MGKTAFALKIARNAAVEVGIPGGLFLPENVKRAARHAPDMSGIKAERLHASTWIRDAAGLGAS